jgi:hypothetical protein
MNSNCSGRPKFRAADYNRATCMCRRNYPYRRGRALVVEEGVK